MKNFLILSILFIIIVTLAVFLVFIDTDYGDSSVETPSPEYQVPPDRALGSSAGMKLVATSGLQFTVKPFIDDGVTLADPVNDGYYILSGDLGYCLSDGTCPNNSVSDTFTASYSATDDFFSVLLLKEPIAESRKQAEAFLRAKLGLTEEEMCYIRYSIAVPYWVNEFYAGGNLGFSFCPNAFPLE